MSDAAHELYTLRRYTKRIPQEVYFGMVERVCGRICTSLEMTPLQIGLVTAEVRAFKPRGAAYLQDNPLVPQAGLERDRG